jgi:hypothetical protein
MKEQLKKRQLMKKQLYFLCALALTATFTLNGCKNNPQHKETATEKIDDSQAEQDSTIYGVCGDGTMMHTLELITDAGDTLTFALPDTEDGTDPVVGGLLAGDHLAVVKGQPIDGEETAKKVINLTTLQGKWTSIDKNFEIMEGGEVKSNVEAEKDPWTSWKILNGKLLLNRDTFDIDNLGSDSLELENHAGIFLYKRAK